MMALGGHEGSSSTSRSSKPVPKGEPRHLRPLLGTNTLCRFREVSPSLSSLQARWLCLRQPAARARSEFRMPTRSKATERASSAHPPLILRFRRTHFLPLPVFFAEMEVACRDDLHCDACKHQFDLFG